MNLNNNQKAFLALLRAGLWEQEAQLSAYGKIDLKEVYKLAQEQAVLGLVAAGLEHVADVKLSKEEILQFVREALQLEQRNTAMNYFIGVIVEKMRNANINTFLLKGQGLAQCYERPMWRTCGDVDFLFSADNYNKALDYLRPLATRIEDEFSPTKHIALIIDTWEVELHGSLRGGLWRSLEKELDNVHEEVITKGAIRSWMNNGIQVCMPRVEEDSFYVFSHILQHFFQEGVGLRQVCDWCRLLWSYRSDINIELLQTRIRKAGIVTEWKAFAALAVNFLGMPADAMPFYSSFIRWKNKAEKIWNFIVETGNMGHNRDYSIYDDKPYVVAKAISFWRHSMDTYKYFSIFPADSLRVMWRKIIVGIDVVIEERICVLQKRTHGA